MENFNVGEIIYNEYTNLFQYEFIYEIEVNSCRGNYLTITGFYCNTFRDENDILSIKSNGTRVLTDIFCI